LCAASANRSLSTSIATTSQPARAKASALPPLPQQASTTRLPATSAARATASASGVSE
jgi:hypothetical protein